MAQAGAPRIQIYLLGAFDLRVADCSVDGPVRTRRKIKALIKLLALHPRKSMNREQVIETLWPSADLQSGLNSLHQSLFLLRKALGEERVVTQHDGVLSLESDVWIDVDAFHAAAAAAHTIEQHEQAISLYRGELLPEDLYEEWSARPREDLAAAHRRLLLEAAALYAAAGDAGGAERKLRNAIACDPLEEHAHSRLIHLLADQGALRRARAQYRAFHAALASELGVEPSAQIQALAASIEARLESGEGDPPAEQLRVQYARSADGTSIAYTAHGQGDRRPLMHLPFLPWGGLQLEWDIPEWRTWIARLARQRTVVRYDARSIGMSQHEVDDISYERQVEDLEAVADALNLRCFDLFVAENTGPIAIMYAVRHPERIGRLVFYYTWVDGPELERAFLQTGFRQTMKEQWNMYIDTMGRWAVGHDEVLGGRNAEWMRGCSPEFFDRFWEAIAACDVSPLVPQLGAPALMIQRSNIEYSAAPGSREWTACLPHGEVMQVEGSALHPIAGDIEPLAGAIEQFLNAG